MDKHFVFRHYWWIAGVVTATAIVLILAFVPSSPEGLIATTLGAASGSAISLKAEAGRTPAIQLIVHQIQRAL